MREQVSGTFPRAPGRCCKGTPFQSACSLFYGGTQHSYQRSHCSTQLPGGWGMSCYKLGRGRGSDPNRAQQPWLPDMHGLRERKAECGGGAGEGRPQAVGSPEGLTATVFLLRCGFCCYSRLSAKLCARRRGRTPRAWGISFDHHPSPSSWSWMRELAQNVPATCPLGEFGPGQLDPGGHSLFPPHVVHGGWGSWHGHRQLARAGAVPAVATTASPTMCVFGRGQVSGETRLEKGLRRAVEGGPQAQRHPDSFSTCTPMRRFSSP